MSDGDGLLIYGAYGYTGELVARLAAARGLRPTLAGRDASKLRAVAGALGLPERVFGLDDPAALDAGLDGMAVVLHCAGPFTHTSRPMADACVRRGVHYLDITGEPDVFAALAARDDEARAAGVMLLPGVGFDVVPSDCLAAHLGARLPGATSLELAFLGIGRPSRGTLRTVLENLHRGGLVRQGGELVRVPPAHATRTVDFGRGPTKVTTIPWGDVVTAWYSTGIPDIRVYTRLPAPALLRLGRPALGLLGAGPVRRLARRLVDAGPPGPTAEQRARARSYLWGEVRDAHGGVARARLETPDGYDLTADAALTVATRVLGGVAAPGFQTPSRLLGADFVLSLHGVSRTDL